MPTIKTPTKSVTGPQLKSSASVILTPAYSAENQKVAELPRDDYGTLTPQKIREMRRDPTISMVRQLIVAPALLAAWSYEEKEDAPKDSGQFIEENIAPLRSYMIRQTLLGCVDFGWASFEKIFRKDGTKVKLAKMKPLLQDWTDILVDRDNGAYLGLQQHVGAKYVYIPVTQSFLHSFDPEGTYWYGASYMGNVEKPYDSWNTIDASSSRYDEKIAGSHWVVHYPIGTSMHEGTETDNEVIARSILNSLQASGGIAVPKSIENFVQDLNAQTPKAWEIELMSDSGATSASFTDRQSYYDKLKVRGFGFPERSILEGQFGTKAEAEAHADFAIANVLLRTEDLVRDLNWHVVNQLLRLNYGPESENTVVINSGALGEKNRQFLQNLYTKLLDKPEGFTAEFDNIDRGSLRDLLEVPTDEEAEADDLRDEIGRRDGLRIGQRGEVGGPEQQPGPNGNNPEDNLVPGGSGRPDQRTPDDGTLRDTVRNTPEDDNDNRGPARGVLPVRE